MPAPSCPVTGTTVLTVVLFLSLLLFIPPVSGLVTLEYFHHPDCITCIRTDPILLRIEQQYGDRIAVERILLDDRAAVRLLLSYGQTEIPVVVVQHTTVLPAREITKERLTEEISRFESGEYTGAQDSTGSVPRSVAVTVLVSYVLGLMTGISPCLLGGLVVMIAAIGSRGPSPRSRYLPLLFGAGLVTMYTGAALCILAGGVAIPVSAGYRPAIIVAAGTITIAAGLVLLGLVRLPGKVQSRTEALLSRTRTAPGAFLLGIVFAVLLAPCAVAPFLILIDLVLIRAAGAPVLMALAFCAGILTPFAALALAQDTIGAERLIRYSGIIQKVSGVLLVAFGTWLILSLLPL